MTGYLDQRITQNFQVHYSYPVCFTHHIFAPGNPLLADLIAPTSGKKSRMLVVLDANLYKATPDLSSAIIRYAEAHADLLDLVRSPWVVRGGEDAKNDPREVEELYHFVGEFGLCRHSYIVIVGGGAVLDAIGFAAATAHRGIRVVRLPSTVLGQNDAGVGVKNAINWQGRKNFLGTFVPPYAVINDFALFSTSSRADQRAGIAEAIKVALIRDRTFFEFLHSQRHALAALEVKAMEQMIVRCAELHLAQIRNSGDPFEYGSARPLDFGHWSAHKLEELSHHQLRHGEAVAIGIMLDTLYSRSLGLIGHAQVDEIYHTLHDIGFAVHHPAVDLLDIGGALNEFREHLGGELCITLLARIGQGCEVNAIDSELMGRCIEELRTMP